MIERTSSVPPCSRRFLSRVDYFYPEYLHAASTASRPASQRAKFAPHLDSELPEAMRKHYAKTAKGAKATSVDAAETSSSPPPKKPFALLELDAIDAVRRRVATALAAVSLPEAGPSQLIVKIVGPPEEPESVVNVTLSSAFVALCADLRNQRPALAGSSSATMLHPSHLATHHASPDGAAAPPPTTSATSAASLTHRSLFGTAASPSPSGTASASSQRPSVFFPNLASHLQPVGGSTSSNNGSGSVSAPPARKRYFEDRTGGVLKVLNKVSRQRDKFLEVKKELMRLPLSIQVSDPLAVAKVFFLKAVSDPEFSDLYAQLAKEICVLPEGHRITGDISGTFGYQLRCALIRQCQHEVMLPLQLTEDEDRDARRKVYYDESLWDDVERAMSKSANTADFATFKREELLNYGALRKKLDEYEAMVRQVSAERRARQQEIDDGAQKYPTLITAGNESPSAATLPPLPPPPWQYLYEIIPQEASNHPLLVEYYRHWNDAMEDTFNEKKKRVVNAVRFVGHLFLCGLLQSKVINIVLDSFLLAPESGIPIPPPSEQHPSVANPTSTPSSSTSESAAGSVALRIPLEYQIDIASALLAIVSPAFFQTDIGRHVYPRLVERVLFLAQQHPIFRCRCMMLKLVHDEVLGPLDARGVPTGFAVSDDDTNNATAAGSSAPAAIGTDPGNDVTDGGVSSVPAPRLCDAPLHAAADDHDDDDDDDEDVTSDDSMRVGSDSPVPVSSSIADLRSLVTPEPQPPRCFSSTALKREAAQHKFDASSSKAVVPKPPEDLFDVNVATAQDDRKGQPTEESSHVLVSGKRWAEEVLTMYGRAMQKWWDAHKASLTSAVGRRSSVRDDGTGTEVRPPNPLLPPTSGHAPAVATPPLLMTPENIILITLSEAHHAFINAHDVVCYWLQRSITVQRCDEARRWINLLMSSAAALDATRLVLGTGHGAAFERGDSFAGAVPHGNNNSNKGASESPAIEPRDVLVEHERKHVSAAHRCIKRWLIDAAMGVVEPEGEDEGDGGPTAAGHSHPPVIDEVREDKQEEAHAATARGAEVPEWMWKHLTHAVALSPVPLASPPPQLVPPVASRAVQPSSSTANPVAPGCPVSYMWPRYFVVTSIVRQTSEKNVDVMTIVARKLSMVWDSPAGADQATGEHSLAFPTPTSNTLFYDVDRTTPPSTTVDDVADTLMCPATPAVTADVLSDILEAILLRTTMSLHMHDIASPTHPNAVNGRGSPGAAATTLRTTSPDIASPVVRDKLLSRAHYFAATAARFLDDVSSVVNHDPQMLLTTQLTWTSQVRLEAPSFLHSPGGSAAACFGAVWSSSLQAVALPGHTKDRPFREGLSPLPMPGSAPFLHARFRPAPVLILAWYRSLLRLSTALWHKAKAHHGKPASGGTGSSAAIRASTAGVAWLGRMARATAPWRVLERTQCSAMLPPALTAISAAVAPTVATKPPSLAVVPNLELLALRCALKWCVHAAAASTFLPGASPPPPPPSAIPSPRDALENALRAHPHLRTPTLPAQIISALQAGTMALAWLGQSAHAASAAHRSPVASAPPVASVSIFALAQGATDAAFQTWMQKSASVYVEVAGGKSSPLNYVLPAPLELWKVKFGGAITNEVVNGPKAIECNYVALEELFVSAAMLHPMLPSQDYGYQLIRVLQEQHTIGCDVEAQFREDVAQFGREVALRDGTPAGWRFSYLGNTLVRTMEGTFIDVAAAKGMSEPSPLPRLDALITLSIGPSITIKTPRHGSFVSIASASGHSGSWGKASPTLPIAPAPSAAGASSSGNFGTASFAAKVTPGPAAGPAAKASPPQGASPPAAAVSAPSTSSASSWAAAAGRGRGAK